MTLAPMNAKNIIQPWFHTFLYGPSGAGKTTIANTWPRPVFVVPRNEGSMVSLAGLDVDYYEAVDLSSRVQNGSGGLICIVDALESEYYKDPDNFPYDTIVLDSLSHYADLAVEQIGGPQGKMDQQKWGELSTHFRNIQARLRRLEVYVVFTALSHLDKGKDGELEGGPLIQGQTSTKLPSACELYSYCEMVGAAKARKVRAHMRRYKHYPARIRVPPAMRPQVPDFFDDFSFQKIEHLLGGQPTEQPERTEENAQSNA